MQKKLRVEFIPTPDQVRMAKEYADRTMKYTEATSFEAPQNKHRRITQGVVCEYIIRDFFVANGRGCELREKPDYLADTYDLVPEGIGLTDVKSSYSFTMPPQVHRKNPKIKQYVFCFIRFPPRADREIENCLFVEIMGWQKESIVTQAEYFIPRGGTIPWYSKGGQAFGNGSFFYTGPLIIPESLITGIIEYIQPDGHGGYREA